MQHLWKLDPQIDFLNHGSFGACPSNVLQAQHDCQIELEREPIRFLAPERELEPKLDFVRSVVAKTIGCDPQDLGWVRNATEGVNAVLRSLNFQAGDEVIMTNHGYNACNNAARYALEKAGGIAKTVPIPFPIADPQQIVDIFESALSTRTRLLLVDHVSSPTGIVFPVESIIAAAHARQIRVFIDGAHAPGMLPLNLRQLNPDYYTANHHKWLCSPKASGFLYVRRELQREVRPLIISHAANRPRPGRSQFLAEFDWQGTFDPSPLLAVPAAISFLENLFPGGLAELMHRNRTLTLTARASLAKVIGAPLPAPDSMIGSLATIPLPAGSPPAAGQVDQLQQRLFDRYRIEVPIIHWPDSRSRWLRISVQAYNHLAQYQRLAEALRSEQLRF